MTKIEKNIEAAWQRSRGAEEYDPGYPVKASSNFVDGFKAGAEWALSHQWVSVEDALPEDDAAVLIICEYGTVIGEYERKQGWLGNGFGDVSSVTHWMPIPPLPITKKEGVK